MSTVIVNKLQELSVGKNILVEDIVDFKSSHDTSVVDETSSYVALGLVNIGDYDSGPLVVDSTNKFFTKDGNHWKASDTLVLPYLTVENWVTDQSKFVRVVDVKLRQDLANTADVAKGAAQIARGDQIVNSITELRALLKTSASKFAFVNGYYVAGDGGGGQYYLDAADTTSADNGGTIIVATDGGRWKLVVKDQVSVKQFGAKGDGIADDTVAIQAALDYAASVNGAVVDEQGKTYKFSFLVIKNGVRSVDFTKGTLKPDATLIDSTLGALRLDGPNRYAGGTAVRNCVVSVRMDMSNGGRVGIGCDSVSDNTFVNCRIFGFTDHATINHYGILFWHSSNRNKVYNNSIIGVTNPTQRGLLVDFIGQGDAFAGYFANSGATTRATNPCVENIVYGNILTDGSYAINLLGGENNIIMENVCKGQNHRSIYMAEACVYNIVASNQLINFLSSAVLLGYGCIENIVYGNICKRGAGVQPALTGEAMININTGAQRNVISHNKCHADTNYGIYLACNMSHNVVQNNEIRGYGIAGIALESDWEAIADRPAGAIYSRPNFATPGSIAPGATQWSFANADSNRIIGNTIREGAAGRSVAGIYVAQVNSNTSLSVVKNEIANNTVIGNADMAHYIYIFEETVDKSVNNKLYNNTWTDVSGIPTPSKIFLSRGRMHFNYQSANDVIDYVVTTFADGDTTPSVAYGGSFAFNNTGATSVTTFDDAPPGMEILIRLGTNTTLVHSTGSLRLASSADVSGRTSNDWLRLRNASLTSTPLWIETSRSFSLALTGSATYDPPSLVDGAGATTTVTVTGAALGDIATCSFSLSTQGITVTANVTAADTVTVRFQNETGGTIDLASGTLRARVMRQ